MSDYCKELIESPRPDENGINSKSKVSRNFKVRKYMISKVWATASGRLNR